MEGGSLPRYAFFLQNMCTMHTVYVYNAHMESTARVWVCEQCTHVWLMGEIVPTHCAKCRSRRWNDGDVEGHEGTARRVDGYEAKDQHGSRDGASLSVLPKAKGASKQLHSVQPMRDKLVRLHLSAPRFHRRLHRYEKMVASMRVTASSPTGPRTGVAPVV